VSARAFEYTAISGGGEKGGKSLNLYLCGKTGLKTSDHFL
jgi:hypothetical protein